MPLPDILNVALKEWAVVCDALATGRQVILLRKGGILEAIGGFEVEHPRFLFFPTYLHQSAEQLKPDAHEGLEKRDAEPAEIRISAAGEVTDVLQLKSRQQMEEIDDQHVWARPLIDMRFEYRPKNPLYLLIIRAYRLAEAVTVQNTPAYAGCKSWVPLDRAIRVAGSEAALDDTTFQTRRQLIRSRLEGVNTGF